MTSDERYVWCTVVQSRWSTLEYEVCVNFVPRGKKVMVYSDIFNAVSY